MVMYLVYPAQFVNMEMHVLTELLREIIMTSLDSDGGRSINTIPLSYQERLDIAPLQSAPETVPQTRREVIWQTVGLI